MKNHVIRPLISNVLKQMEEQAAFGALEELISDMLITKNELKQIFYVYSVSELI